MPRGFDRTDGDYAPIALLLDEKLKGYLDRLLELSIPPTEFEAVLDRELFVTTRSDDGTLGTAAPGLALSGSERARLRLALWFWNSAWIKLRHEDFLRLDVTNTHRLVRALGRFMRVAVVTVPDLEPLTQLDLDRPGTESFGP
jgi:hypothetical protein